ncbi:hypothetical protein C8F04DRAFT_1192909 [Mycena alexandri]|uniref:Bacteriophage T5 Orf172 DNA-binding domain-containing protein n=1 Tax=Mycena alexandri TaxID=1745969 RepID=A0AAD6S9V7_9AGAR|nr:hypothetical protein C8F04DRAFT_1192909 [Mycena alexandri]
MKNVCTRAKMVDMKSDQGRADMKSSPASPDMKSARVSLSKLLGHRPGGKSLAVKSCIGGGGLVVGSCIVGREKVGVVVGVCEESRMGEWEEVGWTVVLAWRRRVTLWSRHSLFLDFLQLISHLSTTMARQRRSKAVHSPIELKRRKALAAISRIPDPLDQCMAHLKKSNYNDFRGELYTVFRVLRVFDHEFQMDVDVLDIKSGYSLDSRHRQLDYRDTCRGVKFLWMYKYTSDNIKHLERLVHLSLRALGAQIPTFPCPGCGVKHREFYSVGAAGGIDGLCAIIEFWLEVLGQPVESRHEQGQYSMAPFNLGTAICQFNQVLRVKS